MVNSASQTLAEFKSQRMGGLLSGFSSQVSAPTIAGTSLSDTANDRLVRSAPKKSSTMFMDQVRQSGKRMHQSALMGIQNQRQMQQTPQRQMGNPVGRGSSTAQSGYRLPTGGKPQTGGPRGAYGITLPAGAAFAKLSAAYKAAGMGNLSVNSGGRTYQEQAKLYAAYKAGRGNKAAAPGTSLHESGIALDLGGPLYNTNMQAAMATRQHQWMRQNAAQFGWYWVGKNYGESWHWEYRPN